MSDEILWYANNGVCAELLPDQIEAELLPDHKELDEWGYPRFEKARYRERL
ncbi:hypothetical protein JIX56_11810 [Streptomyces sp. CA-210063]|uniref:hypothetical protein n=1 Tax=Streptomyces sp. CA-210063 TaxID=2801029 RepID=UPI00214BB2E3|nr:hypothetical protein [Streptomyces sp. CA-210063]UUU30534.1 hypothetical protein JIX56_11810 [Streptomyces sp. CA-210063]